MTLEIVLDNKHTLVKKKYCSSHAISALSVIFPRFINFKVDTIFITNVRDNLYEYRKEKSQKKIRRKLEFCLKKDRIIKIAHIMSNFVLRIIKYFFCNCIKSKTNLILLKTKID